MLGRFVFVCALIVLVAVSATAPTAMAERACESANATPAQAAKRTVIRATLCTINAERDSYGLKPLRLNRTLSRVAEQHATDMVRRDYFAHDSLGGGTFLDRIRRSGYLRGAQSWLLGENLGWGAGNSAAPRVITERWMHSPAHRANILRSSFREIGIGLAIGAPKVGGPAATYATEFGFKG